MHAHIQAAFGVDPEFSVQHACVPAKFSMDVVVQNLALVDRHYAKTYAKYLHRGKCVRFPDDFLVPMDTAPSRETVSLTR